jgi:hypothetical protein
MIPAKELKRWLNTLPKDAHVYVDDGGLMLSVLDSEACLGIGGHSTDHEEVAAEKNRLAEMPQYRGRPPRNS